MVPLSKAVTLDVFIFTIKVIKDNVVISYENVFPCDDFAQPDKDEERIIKENRIENILQS